MPFQFRSTLAILLLLVCTSASAGVLLEPAPSPDWDVSEWINGRLGTIGDQQGKIVVIEFFQLWCPVCNEFSLPLMQRWQKRYGERTDFLLVSIHTVFEGFDEQTPQRLRSFVQEKQILRPVGIDRTDPDSPYPATMQRFNTGGTPHIVVVDRQGLLRFSHFGYFDPEPVEAFLDRLLDEKEPKAGKSKGSGDPRATPALPTRRPPKPPRRPQVQAAPEPPIVPRRAEPEEEPEQEPPQEQFEEGAAGQAEDPTRQEEPAAEGQEADAEQPAEEAQQEEPAQEEPAEAQAEAQGQPEQEQEEEEGEEEEQAPKDPLAELSGSYRLRIEQSAKSCGETSPVQELIAQVTVSGNRFEAGFSRAHLGLRRVEGSFDPGAQRFTAVLDQKANYGAAVLQVHLETSGRFFEGPNGPELEFEYRYSQQGEAPDSSCDVEGHGTGSSVRRR